jgi:hypothetical protein
MRNTDVMDQQNPLTDPTCLIAYRLANGDSSLGTEPAHPAASNTRMSSPGIVALGLVIAAIIAITVLVL